MRTLRSTLPVFVSVFVSLLLLAGCSGSEQGNPVAGDGTTTDRPTGEPGTTEPAPPTTSEPGANRPRDIDLTKADICEAVGKLPLTSYGMDAGHPPRASKSSIFPNSTNCFAEGVAKNLSVSVVGVVSQGFDSYVSTSIAQVTKGTAAGFPSAVIKGQDKTVCFDVVDVHDGQMVYVAYGMNSPTGKPATPQPTLCQRAQAIAAAVTTALG